MTKQVSWRQRVPKVREEEGQIVEPAPLALASPLLVAENLRDRGDDGQQELPTRKPAPVRKNIKHDTRKERMGREVKHQDHVNPYWQRFGELDVPR